MNFFFAIDSRMDSRRLLCGSDERGGSDERFSLQDSFFFLIPKQPPKEKETRLLKAFKSLD